ncbi:Coq4 family protein [Hyalangium minutum]|uniref:Coenzyme Q (Ubiquinone) biosynthesis protein Coq4 n=1 Tax=Hyalangium minutum TaxID=394096 RepID=A0A085WVZ6_9BACT|nr:Coq4 family protein [Hyalangium minutum]KFE71859.1 hypothetical protein DB31_0120 [Hyalangium minutum]
MLSILENRSLLPRRTIRPKSLLLALQTSNDPSRFGDFQIYKLDAMDYIGPPEIQKRLEAVRGYLPKVDRGALRQMPDGTLGREYMRFLDDNKLNPFEISDDDHYLQEVFKRNTFAVRFTAMHDMYHLLLGFETTMPGEYSVTAFAEAQNCSLPPEIVPLFKAGFHVYKLLKPDRAKELQAGWDLGFKLGKTVRFMCDLKFEDMWERPIDDVRRELGIPDIKPQFWRHGTGPSIYA